MTKPDYIVSFVTDAVIICFVTALVIVAAIFVPYRKSQNFIFLTASFCLFATSVFSIVTDIFVIYGYEICDRYVKTHAFQADPIVIVCGANLRALFSVLSFAFLVFFLFAVIFMKAKLLYRLNHVYLACMLLLLALLFFAVFYLSLTPFVASNEVLGFLLQIVSGFVAVVFAGALVVIELLLLRQKYRVYMCSEPHALSQMADVCNCNSIKGIVFSTGKVVRKPARNTQRSPLLGTTVSKFSFAECLSFCSSVFLFLSMVLFLHVKFAWGQPVAMIEGVLLQIFYALFSLTVVFLLSGYSVHYRARSIVEMLNSPSEMQQFKIYMHEKGNVGFYNLYLKLLQFKVLQVGDGFDDIQGRIKEEISDLLAQLNCTARQDYEDLERLCKGQLLACFVQFQAQSVISDESTSKTLWQMLKEGMNRTQGRELVLPQFISGDFE